MKAVLLDLDGTLLDIDLGRFLSEYFGALSPVIGELTGLSANDAVNAVRTATDEMTSLHGDPSNEAAFNRRFLEITGTDLSDGDAAAGITAFYDGPYTALGADYRPREAAHDLVAAARNAGLAVAVATNPIFPRVAIEHRIRWAGFSPDDFDLVTSYEWSRAAKPHPEFFIQIADALGVRRSDCLMVGDDPVLDMAAADVGMRTFFVGRGTAPACDWSGGLADVAGLIPRLA